RAIPPPNYNWTVPYNSASPDRPRPVTPGMISHAPRTKSKNPPRWMARERLTSALDCEQRQCITSHATQNARPPERHRTGGKQGCESWLQPDARQRESSRRKRTGWPPSGRSRTATQARHGSLGMGPAGDHPDRRVARGGCPPRAPTDPYVRDYRIRLLGAGTRCEPVNTFSHPLTLGYQSAL